MVKIGLVLSGGGTRGFAHIGVLKVLSANNIKIDAVAGCSMGALIGAGYCYNQNPEDLEKTALKIKHGRDIFDFSFSTSGLIQGKKIEQYISEYLKKDNFEDLTIPLHVDATNMVDEKEVVFCKGKLMPALRAAMSYPGVFTPLKIDSKILVDGGVVNPLPFNLIEKDVDYLILVDVSEGRSPINEKSNFKDIILQSIATMQHKIVENQIELLKTKYILIEPKVNERSAFDFRNIKNCIDMGEKAGKSAIEQINKDLDTLSKPAKMVVEDLKKNIEDMSKVAKTAVEDLKKDISKTEK